MGMECWDAKMVYMEPYRLLIRARIVDSHSIGLSCCTLCGANQYRGEYNHVELHVTRGCCPHPQEIMATYYKTFCWQAGLISSASTLTL